MHDESSNDRATGRSHIGSDAAALATAGTVGEGIHHHHNKERDTLDSNTQGTLGITSSGPHKTATANALDPHVNRSGATGMEDARHHSKHHGGGAEEADHDHIGGKTSQKDSIAERDAALATTAGAGGVGVAEQ